MAGINGLSSYRTDEHILSLFLRMVNNVKNVNPHDLPTSLFDQLLTSKIILNLKKISHSLAKQQYTMKQGNVSKRLCCDVH
jgi:hypothetical protein